MWMGVRRRSPDSDAHEVCITNMYVLGCRRLLSKIWWSPYRGATREECEEYISRIKEASKLIEKDIFSRRCK